MSSVAFWVLPGQGLDLGGDDGEALAGLAGTRGLDCRIQGKKVGLLRNAVDGAQELGDLVDRADQLVRLAFGGLHGAQRVLGGCRGLLDALTSGGDNLRGLLHHLRAFARGLGNVAGSRR